MHQKLTVFWDFHFDPCHFKANHCSPLGHRQRLIICPVVVWRSSLGRDWGEKCLGVSAKPLMPADSRLMHNTFNRPGFCSTRSLVFQMELKRFVCVFCVCVFVCVCVCMCECVYLLKGQVYRGFLFGWHGQWIPYPLKSDRRCCIQ